MTQKTLLIVSAVLTAFVLVVGGAIAARVSQPPAPVEAAPAQAVQSAPAPTTADLNAQVEQLVQQREAQYRQLIEEANQRLAQANRQIATSAQSRSAAPAAFAAQPAQPAQPTASLSTEAARNIAIDVSGGATIIRQPELVSFEGTVAYEVGLTRGVVYVDANTGAVLFDGTHGNGGGRVMAAQQPQSQSQSSGEHEHEAEHEQEQEHDNESHE